MSALLIRDTGTGTAWKVWPEPEAMAPGSVHETGRYVFELRDTPGADGAELSIDDRPLEALRSPSGTARWRWEPGFHAGTVDAELRLQGRNPYRFEIVTDPDVRKLTRSDFECMTREILEDTFALFALTSFRRSIARGSVRPPPIARLEFLRTRVDELELVVGAIVKQPQRTLTADETVVPYYRASRATGPEILKSFRTSRVRSEQQNPSRLPAGMKGFLPAQIRVRRRRSSLDIAEHRQMGASLRAWSGWLSAVSDTLASRQERVDLETQGERARWATRCQRLSRRLGRLAQAAPFSEAGESPPRLMLSAVYRNVPAYQQFFRLWQDMNVGMAAVFGQFLNMPLARTFELYELWCFLRLIRAAAEEYGSQGVATDDLFIADASGGLTLASGAVTVTISNGWRFCFQKEYREFWLEPSGHGSFSREMTPDVAIDGCPSDGGHRIIILDAKYRIDDGLNDALNSIHTYRDAIVQEASDGGVRGVVSAAYLLTPHFPSLTERYRDTRLPGRLFHPEYRSAFRFGAMTMRPGMSIPELRSALRIIAADATT